MTCPFASGIRPVRQQHPEPVFVEHGHLQFDSLVVFRAGDSPTTTNPVFFDTLTRDLAAPRCIASARLVPGVVDQRAGDDDVTPSSGRGPSSTRSSAIRTPADAPLARRSPGASRRRTTQRRPARSSARPRSHGQAPRPERPRWPSNEPKSRRAPRGGRSDVTDGQRDDHAGQWPLLRVLEVPSTLASALKRRPGWEELTRPASPRRARTGLPRRRRCRRRRSAAAAL